MSASARCSRRALSSRAYSTGQEHLTLCTCTLRTSHSSLSSRGCTHARLNRELGPLALRLRPNLSLEATMHRILVSTCTVDQQSRPNLSTQHQPALDPLINGQQQLEGSSSGEIGQLAVRNAGDVLEAI